MAVYPMTADGGSGSALKSNTLLVNTEVYKTKQKTMLEAEDKLVLNNSAFGIHNSYTFDEKNRVYTDKGGYESLEKAIDGIDDDSKMISLIGVSIPLVGDFPEHDGEELA